MFLQVMVSGTNIFATLLSFNQFVECQHPWWPVSEVKCARFLREPFGKYNLPFKEASAVCHSLGEGHAHLLTITSPAEQAAVESHLYSLNPGIADSPYMVDNDFWVQVGGGDDDPASFANYATEEEAKEAVRTVDTSGNSTCAILLVESGKWIRESCNEKHKIVCQKVLFGKAAHLKKLKEEKLENRLGTLENNLQQVLKKLEQRLRQNSFETEPFETKVWSEEEEKTRMEAVKEMARAAWRASSNVGERHNGRLVLGALSTLQVMGLQEEYTEGRQWLEKSFTLRQWTSVCT